MVRIDILNEGYDRILKIYAEDFSEIATIEDSPNIMAIVLQKLHEDPKINTIEIEQDEIFGYYEDSVNLLRELSEIYYNIREDTKRYYKYLLTNNPLYYEFAKIIELLDKNYLYDPIGTYITLKREFRKLLVISEKNVKLKKFVDIIIPLLSKFFKLFENTAVYSIVKPFLSGYDPTTREIYKRIVFPDIRPKFITIKYISSIPENAEIIETYNLDKSTEVVIFKLPNSSNYSYYIFPEEYKLFDQEILLLNKAREIIIQYQPRREDYLDPERLTEIYEKVAENVLDSLIKSYNIAITNHKKKLIKNILIRYIIGFGILEKFALDEKIQDIFVNPPPGLVPIAIQHADYGLCITNVIPTRRELESWATKLRLMSGRPFDEANPVLDTEIFVNNIRLRVAAMTRPLSPKGLTYVFRRHRSKPWTLPLFIENRMLSPLSAALLSFFVENGRTMLIAGTRGAGKTSLLTALMLEIPQTTRILTIEDTMEIPVDYMRKLGYNIVPMKVKSPLSLSSSELSAEEGVRVSLRLGDSAIILGEVRSTEAKTLYEAMRVGALANAVMGTIHAESPYGVFDRVVNDLGVPRTSFKATDIIVIANPIREPGTSKRYRRVIRITEVRKHWDVDPLKEKGFVDLMIFNTEKDQLEPTIYLLNGDSDVLKSIAARIRALSKSWEQVWDSILIRKEAKELLVEYSKKFDRRDILEADFVVLANSALRKFIEEVYSEHNEIIKDEIINKYKRWLISMLKK